MMMFVMVMFFLSYVSDIWGADDVYSFETGLLTRSGGAPVVMEDTRNNWRRHAYGVVTHPHTQEKLHMIPIVSGHYRHMLRLSVNPDIMKMCEIQEPYEFSKDQFNTLIERGNEGKPTWWFIFKGDEVTEEGFIGAAGSYLDPTTAFVNVCGLGLPEFWGKGYASAIFPHMLACVDEYIVEGLGDSYNGFEAMAHPESAATLQLLQQSSFVQEGDAFTNKAGHPRLRFVWRHPNA